MKLIHATAAALVIGASSVAANAATSPALIGEMASPSYANRTLFIDSGTRSVNVTQGETVKFVLNDGRTFAIDFDGVAEPVNLQRLVPAGMLDHRVNAYIAESPLNLPN